MWSCKPCAERRKHKWFIDAWYGGEILLQRGAELSFVTLTSHKAVNTFYAGIVVWRRAWPKLSARWRRASPGLQYLWIPERGKLGRFHAHLITTAALDTRWYKDNGARTGLGYQAAAEKITTASECGAYMVKYLTKSIASTEYPKGFRRVNTSQKWPKIKKHVSEHEWRYIGTDDYDFDRLLSLYAARGWHIHNAFCDRG